MDKCFIFILLTLLQCSCAVPPTQQEINAADYGIYPIDYESLIKEHMGTTLKDPESARYIFLNKPRGGWSGIGGSKYGYVVCATINAKNSFGAYTGNRISFFMIKNGRVIDASVSSGDYEEAMVRGRCKKFI